MARSTPTHLLRTILVCVTAVMAAPPLFAWAQASGGPDTTIILHGPAAKAAAPATAPKAASLSDSARAALRSQIDRQLKSMADSLKLTPEQRAKARPILLDHAYQVKKLHDRYVVQPKTPASMEAVKKEMQGLRDSTDAKLAHVFTADQMIHYKRMRDEALTNHRSAMGIPSTPDTAHAAPAPPAAAASSTPAPAAADTTAKKK